MGRAKVFLGDLVHTGSAISMWTFPLNIGFVGAYAKQRFPTDIELRLFKRPESMIHAIVTERPDVVALSYYVWNERLNHRVFEVAKNVSKDILTIGGGPHFTNINANEVEGRAFFGKQPFCDAFVVNQGEIGFSGVLERFLGEGRRGVGTEAIPGVILNVGDAVVFGGLIDALKDLNEIPSPYLDGLLDPFMAEPFNPIIETNRSCPYRCTFCAWGIGTTKLTYFSLDRVLDEVEYIARRSPKGTSLHFADANFAILDRDVEIARKVYDCHLKFGFPHTVAVQWNKSRPDRVKRVALEMHGIAPIGASVQTLYEPSLDVVKRKNLPLDTITDIAQVVKSEHGTMFSECILGLPRDTFESHVDTNRKLIDAGIDEIHNYNLHLLPGTDMETPASRAEYFKRTAWRLHDAAFGDYLGKRVFEGQEVVIETSTMSTDELRSFRLIHFLLQMMWSKRFYREYLEIQRTIGIHPVDFVIKVADAFRTATGVLGAVYDRFRRDHDLELFPSLEALVDYWTQEENFTRLSEGGYGKLNYQYTFVVMQENRAAFDSLVLAVSMELSGQSSRVPAGYVSQCEEILRFNRLLSLELNEHREFAETRRSRFSYDILSWRQSHYHSSLRQYEGEPVEYEFYLPPRKNEFIRKRLRQYDSSNVNLTMRKATEYVSPDKFMYEVRVFGVAEERPGEAEPSQAELRVPRHA